MNNPQTLMEQEAASYKADKRDRLSIAAAGRVTHHKWLGTNFPTHAQIRDCNCKVATAWRVIRTEYTNTTQGATQ